MVCILKCMTFIVFLQISNFEYLMQLNTLAGRSYNDITQVYLHFYCFSFFFPESSVANPYSICNILLQCVLGSIQFSPGFFLTTVQRAWIFLILLVTETCQRFFSWILSQSVYVLYFCIIFLLRKHFILLQPIGALNPDRLKKFQERYSNFDDPVIPKFHYGSHYSSAGTVGFLFILVLCFHSYQHRMSVL